MARQRSKSPASSRQQQQPSQPTSLSTTSDETERQKKDEKTKSETGNDENKTNRKNAGKSISNSPTTTTTITKATTPGPNDDDKEIQKENQNSLQSPSDRVTVGDGEIILFTTPPPTTLDVSVHRVRHLDYIPSEILAMASSSSIHNNKDSVDDDDESSSLLAISRRDGSMELFETTFIQDYHQHASNNSSSSSSGKIKWSPHLFPLATIAGSKRAIAHSIAFVNATSATPMSKRSTTTLVAASPDGTLWTVQFAGQSRQLQSRIPSGGGGVFDLATCSSSDNDNDSSSSPLSSLIAGACQDGSVRVWQVRYEEEQEKGSAGGGRVQIQVPPIATLSTAGSPVLSVAWRCERQVGDIFDTVVFAGVADGTIRKYNVQFQKKSTMEGKFMECIKHQSILRMTVESRGRKTPTKIWTMQTLSDGSLVTGNSLGQIQIFDTNTGTLLQTVNQTEIKADVLRLTVNASETKIFASGVDSRVVCLERSSANVSTSTWKFTTAQRPHTHDVKSVAIVRGKSLSNGSGSGNSRHMEALITGGVDTKICTYLVSDFAKKRPQVYYPWPSQSPVSSTTVVDDDNAGSQSRILSIHRANHIELYRLDNEQQAMRRLTRKDSSESSASSTELIGEIALEAQSNLALSVVCPTGKWLAAANGNSFFLFRLNNESNGTGEDMDMDIQPEKVKLPRPLEQLTVTAIHFGSSDTMYIADSSHRLFVVDLSNDVKVVTTMEIPLQGDDAKLPICSIQTSSDRNFLVVMNKTRRDGAIHIFRRQRLANKGNDDEYGHYWTIPSLGGIRPAAIATIGNTQIAVATVSFQIYVFDLDQKKLNPWSETNKFPIEKWPSEISHRKDFPVRLMVNPKNDSQLIMVRPPHGFCFAVCFFV